MARFFSIFRSCLRQLFMLAAFLLVVLAVYVSVGRQLMPMLGDYKSRVETELSARLGLPIQLGQVSGSWNRLNPGISMEQVQLSVPGEDQLTPLMIEQFDLELDVLSSLQQRRLVLSHMTIGAASLRLQQQESGIWQLAGVDAGAVVLTAAQALELVSRFEHIEFSDLNLQLEAADGSVLQLERGDARLQAVAGRFLIEINAHLPGQDETVFLAADFLAEEESKVTGEIYARLPEGDFSALSSLLVLGDWQGRHVAGSVEIWLELQQGQLWRTHAQVQLPELALSRSDEQLIDVQQVQAGIDIRRTVGDQGWDILLQDMGFVWRGRQWPVSDLSLRIRDETGLVAQLGAIDIGIMRDLVSELALLPTPAQTTLNEFSPRGRLHSLVLSVMEEQDTYAAKLQAELEEVSIDARRGAPAIWGLNGYTELEYSGIEQQLSGQFEIDSETFMLHLPQSFNKPWSYDKVNGRVKVQANLSADLDLQLSSRLVTLESSIISGRARFSVDYARTAEGEISSGLELMVGALSADIAGKSAYLPTGPGIGEGLLETMQWVDVAVRSGDASGSGLIYRGSTMPGATTAEKTLQMFYRLDSGVLEFDPEWPALEKLDGLTIINDGQVDVFNAGGETLGIGFDSARASIRANPDGTGSWLSVTGKGGGSAAAGLAYLQETPVTSGFGSYLSGWQAEGEVSVALQLDLPLFIAGAQAQVNLQVDMQDNALRIPEYDLDMTQLNGSMHYRESTGLVAQAMTATVFDQAASLSIRSDGLDASVPVTEVVLESQVEIDRFAEWELHSPLLRAVLDKADGVMNYQAKLVLPQLTSASDGDVPRLSFHSRLGGVTTGLPAPLNKPVDKELPLQLDMDFLADGKRRLRASLADLASLDVLLSNDSDIERGLIYLGTRNESLPVRRFNTSAPGLEVLGQLQTFDYDQWSNAVMDIFTNSGSSTLPGREFPLVGDIRINDAYFLGQHVADLGLQISSQTGSWKLELDSNAVAGSVVLPLDQNEYIQADLRHLRLPAAEEEADVTQPVEESTETESAEEMFTDTLADVDPRTFPRLLFATEELMIGGADYGNWQFTLDPVEDGALLTNLVIASRGLELGSGNSFSQFLWSFDGNRHGSRLQAHITAEDMAEVLSAFGFAPSLESDEAEFNVDVNWEGSPAAFSVFGLQGVANMSIRDGRFLQGGNAASNSALKLISILNFDALVRRLRFSDDLLRSGLSYEEIQGTLLLDKGNVQIADRLQIIGPSSLFQIAGNIDIRNETIDGSMYITLPLSDNIPWMSGLAALNNLINWQVAIGVFLFERIFSNQVDNLTSAQYILKGPWEGLQPQLNQVFTAGNRAGSGAAVPVPVPAPAPTSAAGTPPAAGAPLQQRAPTPE
ncbi:MAG: YhdP family protein [Pseudomonadales bacterium]|nr:YhdP family protein [Pseudomonadales bacterium]